MPKKTGPREYELREPVVAVKIEPPFNVITQWCPEAQLVRSDSHGGKVVGVRTKGMSGMAGDGKLGDYIQRHLHKGEHVYLCVPGHVFERDYVERRRP